MFPPLLNADHYRPLQSMPASDLKAHLLEKQPLIDESAKDFSNEIKETQSALRTLPCKKFVATLMTFSNSLAIPLTLFSAAAYNYPQVRKYLCNVTPIILSPLLPEKLRPWTNIGLGVASIGALLLFANRRADNVENKYNNDKKRLERQKVEARAHLITHMQTHLRVRVEELSEASQRTDIVLHQAASENLNSLNIERISEGLAEIGLSDQDVQLLTLDLEKALEDIRQDLLQLQDSAPDAHTYNAKLLLQTEITKDNCLPKTVKSELPTFKKPPTPSGHGTFFGLTFFASSIAAAKYLDKLPLWETVFAQTAQATACASQVLITHKLKMECFEEIQSVKQIAAIAAIGLSAATIGGMALSKVVRSRKNRQPNTARDTYNHNMKAAVEATKSMYDGIALTLESEKQQLDADARALIPIQDGAPAHNANILPGRKEIVASHAQRLADRMEDIEDALEDSGLDFLAAGMSRKTVTEKLQSTINRIQQDLKSE